jgi:hypothetical protein
VDTVARLSAMVRVLIQLTLWPICAFVFVCIVLEFVGGTRARARSTGENPLKALLGITLKNRRRYGGYIVHIGVLLIAIGIYYSSLYEAEGTVVTQPGGYGVLTDDLTGRKFLVVFEDGDRTDSWNFLHEAFGDEERAKVYENMMRQVRMNPDMDANEIVESVVENARAGNNGELPPALAQNLPRMTAAIHWGVNQRDAEDQAVYEEYNSVLHVYRYRPPQALDAADYRREHDVTRDLLLRRVSSVTNEQEAGMLLARLLVNNAMLDRGKFRERLAEGRQSFQAASQEEFLEATGLAALADDMSREALERVRPALARTLDEFESALDRQILHSLSLGAELPALHRTLRREAASLSPQEFEQTFGVKHDDPEYATRRFNLLESLETWHNVVETQVTKARNELAYNLALNIRNPESLQVLQDMRPLAVHGLRNAWRDADDETAALIEQEIHEATRDAITVAPRMRIFYNKRTGTPRMQEPLKDPVYHRTPSRDLYFILQDVRTDDTATFRFFVKPHMTIGLIGLLVLIGGTVLAFLPAMPRRRRTT